MSGPKHLWSGDWQQESEAASADRTTRQPIPPDEPPTPRPPRRAPAPPRKGLRRALPVTLVAVAFLAAAAIGLAALLSSGGHKTSPSRTQASATAPHRATPTPRPSTPQPTAPQATAPPGQPTTPQGLPTTPQPTTPTSPAVTPAPSPAVPTQQVSWLGMQIETLPPGAAVIETVKLGSRGDLAGLDPGDVIVAVNNRAINGAGSIVRAVEGLHSGDQVPVEVSHGSALEQVNITLATPPFVHP